MTEIKRPTDYDASVVDPLSQKHHRKAGGQKGTQRPLAKMFQDSLNTARSTLGWRPTCACKSEVVPCVVLDPFAGAGTTLSVAKRLGRNYIGVELNPKYVKDLIAPRLEQIDPLFKEE